MARLGADVEQLEKLSNTFGLHRDRLRESIQRMESDLTVIWWKGRDANEFRDRWASVSKPQLARLAEALDEAQLRLLKHADEQRSISEG